MREISSVTDRCGPHQRPLGIASISETAGAENMLTFDQASMRETFEAAVASAQQPGFWRAAVPQAEPWDNLLGALGIDR